MYDFCNKRFNFRKKSWFYWFEIFIRYHVMKIVADFGRHQNHDSAEHQTSLLHRASLAHSQNSLVTPLHSVTSRSKLAQYSTHTHSLVFVRFCHSSHNERSQRIWAAHCATNSLMSSGKVANFSRVWCNLKWSTHVIIVLLYYTNDNTHSSIVVCFRVSTIKSMRNLRLLRARLILGSCFLLGASEFTWMEKNLSAEYGGGNVL